MKNTKIKILSLTFGALAFAMSLSTPFAKEDKRVELKEFIVELNNNSLGNQDLVKEDQSNFLNNLNTRFGGYYSVGNNYTRALNAVVIRGPEALGDAIKTIPGVTHVTENRMYHFAKDDVIYSDHPLADAPMDGNSDEDYVLAERQKTNYSAENMNALTYDRAGEGTLIAILDASFAVDPSQSAKAYSWDGNEPFREENDFAHEWFKDIDSSLVKYTKSQMRELVSTDGFHGAPKSGVEYGKFGSTYLNNKIPFYFDYGGDSNHSRNNDYNVYSQYDEHGTHVASIAAANGDEYKGIAPNAQLALMKVFYEQFTTSNGQETASIGAYDDDILEALEDCLILDVDVLNMSLGSDLDDFAERSASTRAFANLQAQGVTCSVSAGNDGKGLYSSMGPYSKWSLDSIETGVLGSYANGENSMIIASNELDLNYYESAIIVGYQDIDENGNKVDKTQPVAYSDQAKNKVTQSTTPDELKLATLIATTGQTEFEYCVIPNFGTSADYSTYKSTQGEGFAFDGKIAVVDRGDISFANKAQYAYEAGCMALVVVNNDPTATEFNFGMAWGDSNGYNFPKIPVVFTLYRDRQYFQKAENGLGTLTIAQKTIADNPNASQISDYSSDGPTYDLRMNPEITAPGSSILGAVPGKAGSNGLYEPNRNAWAYLSGTSMAAPNYTGAVALITSNGIAGKSAEEAREYKRTISSRVMSTPKLLTHSNTHPVTGKVIEKDVFYSPRRQGAGLVNVDSTIKSKVYFEGLTVNSDGTFGTVGNKKAKIELKYNDLVKEGKISLSFLAHNEDTKARNYKATLYVLRPLEETYYNYDNHKNDIINYETGEVKEDPENLSDHGKDYAFEGTVFQTNYDTVVATKEFTKTIPTGTSTVDGISYELSNEEKATIDALYKNGTYLEGYVVFEPTDSVDDIQLSIPYLGFYGYDTIGEEKISKYKTASAIEDFDFEKKSSDQKYYPSDLVNYVGVGTTLNRPNMDISSTIAVMSKKESYSLAGSSSLLYNEGNIKNLARTIAYNEETNTLYAGGDNSDVLYIQAFVLRSVATNSITIKDKYGSVVSTQGDDALFDVVNDSKYLFKSHVGSSYVGSGVIAHRASATIPLYSKSNAEARLPDGDYTITISLTTLGSNYTQERTYNLKLDSKNPVEIDKEIVTKGGEEYLRVKVKEEYMTVENTSGQTVIAVNGGFIPFDIHKYNGYYTIDAKVKDIYDLDDEGKVTLNIQDAAGNEIFSIFYLEDAYDGRISVETTQLTAGATVRRRITANELEEGYALDNSYVLSFRDGSGYSFEIDGEYDVNVSFKDKDLETIEIYLDDSETKADYEIVGENEIRFSTSATRFRIKAKAKAAEEKKPYNGSTDIYWDDDDPLNPLKGRLPLILGLSIGGGSALIIGVAIALVLILKKKKS